MRPKVAATSTPLAHPDWARLLADAVEKPGIISQAYSRFWYYSTGNQLLAMTQCLLRGMEPGPIHTFMGWLDVGRHVRKGEKAITLVMPITVKRKADRGTAGLARPGDGSQCRHPSPDGDVPDTHGTIVGMTVFAYKPHWFVLCQTDGDPYVPQELPQWSEARALHALGVDRIPFDHPDGNCQGYAAGRTVSVSPIVALPHKTLFHELGHVQLGHTEKGNRMDDHESTPKNLREVEAECVALICCESLGLGGSAECRGYVQLWLNGESIPDRSAQRIFKAADQILKAGHPAPAHDAE